MNSWGKPSFWGKPARARLHRTDARISLNNTCNDTTLRDDVPQDSCCQRSVPLERRNYAVFHSTVAGVAARISLMVVDFHLGHGNNRDGPRDRSVVLGGGALLEMSVGETPLRYGAGGMTPKAQASPNRPSSRIRVCGTSQPLDDKQGNFAEWRQFSICFVSCGDDQLETFRLPGQPGMGEMIVVGAVFHCPNILRHGPLGFRRFLGSV